MNACEKTHFLGMFAFIQMTAELILPPTQHGVAKTTRHDEALQSTSTSSDGASLKGSLNQQ